MLPPGYIAPCLPALVDRVPSGPDWLHELKWDGYRIIARKEGANVKLWSRAGWGWHGTFPLVSGAIGRLPLSRLVLDSEAVMLRADGTADFFALRSRRALTEARLIVFDLLEVDGQDMRPCPWRNAACRCFRGRARTTTRRG
jgi:bifunctional non-homologous end joining protein LigD